MRAQAMEREGGAGAGASIGIGEQVKHLLGGLAPAELADGLDKASSEGRRGASEHREKRAERLYPSFGPLELSKREGYLGPHFFVRVADRSAEWRRDGRRSDPP
ncbi:MAG TPA: hypothetical protein PKE00_16400, partial [Planctomycetota bacterium]|nr:hypothetical protein [Planctomycetota bacterium]